MISSKRTWLPLGKVGSSYDARQQRAGKEPPIVKRILFSHLILRKKSYAGKEIQRTKR